MRCTLSTRPPACSMFFWILSTSSFDTSSLPAASKINNPSYVFNVPLLLVPASIRGLFPIKLIHRLREAFAQAAIDRLHGGRDRLPGQLAFRRGKPAEHVARNIRPQGRAASDPDPQPRKFLVAAKRLDDRAQSVVASAAARHA